MFSARIVRFPGASFVALSLWLAHADGPVLPPHAQPLGYSLESMASASALFYT